MPGEGPFLRVQPPILLGHVYQAEPRASTVTTVVPLLCWVQAMVLYLGAGTARHRVDRGEDPRQGPTWQQPELAVHIDTLQPFPALCQDGKRVWGLGLLLSLRLSPGLGLAPSHVCRCAGRREGWDQGLMEGVQHRLVGPQREAGRGLFSPKTASCQPLPGCQRRGDKGRRPVEMFLLISRAEFEGHPVPLSQGCRYWGQLTRKQGGVGDRLSPVAIRPWGTFQGEGALWLSFCSSSPSPTSYSGLQWGLCVPLSVRPVGAAAGCL